MAPKEKIQKVLQYMLANGCVKYTDFVAFLQDLKSSDSQIRDEMIVEAVSKLNKTLTNYNMMVRAVADEITYEKYYCLISTADNAITKQASHHTPKEFDYFRLVWQAITQRGETSLDAIKDLALQNKVNNYEQLLEEWHRKLWLVIEDDSIRLGVRSKAELDVLEMMERPTVNADTSH